MTLKESISIILHEWNVQQKDQISKDVGSIKQVFPLKSNPNYIVKTFPIKYKSHIKREEEFYKTHPDICAKILKINYEKGWMIQEKLNTKQFLDELYQTTAFIKKELESKKRKFANSEDDQLQFFISYCTHASHLNLIPIEDLFPSNGFAIKLLEFIRDIQNIQYNASNIDLHQFNVGLDWEGNIKLLDL